LDLYCALLALLTVTIGKLAGRRRS
jgi:hypothetical protein